MSILSEVKKSGKWKKIYRYKKKSISIYSGRRPFSGRFYPVVLIEKISISLTLYPAPTRTRSIDDDGVAEKLPLTVSLVHN